MTPNSKIREFPDLGNKLTAPTKKSVFERQKAEAEAKRQREQQETAAVYEDFVKSFDDADDTLPSSNSGNRPSENFGFPGSIGGPSKRYFSGLPPGPAARGGGLGSLRGGRGGSGPRSLGPPPSAPFRKRAFDGSQPAQRDSGHGLFAFDDPVIGPGDTKVAFRHSDDEEEKIASSRAHERSAPKPTVHLSSLPPGTNHAVIKSILPANLNIDSVRVLPPSGPGSTERRSLSAIVTLAKDTPAIDIDTAVSALQNKYLGWGFYLSLSRHLSSAAIGSGMSAPVGLPSGPSALPFGARPAPTGPVGGLSRAPPPPSHRGGFAPPSSYTSNQFGRGAPIVHVNVIPPSDLKQLKLIHKTLEALITHGPEFEALLMSRYDVQKDEKWAWLWDPRSTGGVWYRWRLWDVLTGAQSRIRSGKGTSQFVFDSGAAWTGPERGLPFEYTTEIDEFVSDSDYNSSDDEDSGDEGRRRQHYQGGGPPPDITNTNVDGDTQTYLNPLQKAKLVHLLVRLPTTNAKLRKGDVARVTAYAIQHAGEGAEEVVDMITSNVQTPFAFSSANPDRKNNGDDAIPKDDDEVVDEDKKAIEKEDTSSSKLIALFIISDILSSSSTSGVRHAWRYRQLFEAALKQRKVFEGLGRLEKDMQWGKLRAEKWKRSVSSLLSLWEGWCVFPQSSQEHFTAVFTNPPLTAAEEAANAEAEKASVAALAAKSRWKTVEEKAKEVEIARPDLSKEILVTEEMDVDVDGDPMDDMDDVDGQPMEDEDEDIDGEPMEDLDGEAMAEDEPESLLPHSRATEEGQEKGMQDQGELVENGSAISRRRRPKAEDMFADSDDE